jgi:isocitrate dehydrogenase
LKEISHRGLSAFLSQKLTDWADFLSQEDPAYKPLFEALSENRAKIVEEFKECQGEPVELGGYYLFDPVKAIQAMNPSPTLNKILSSIGNSL